MPIKRSRYKHKRYKHERYKPKRANITRTWRNQAWQSTSLKRYQHIYDKNSQLASLIAYERSVVKGTEVYVKNRWMVSWG